MIMKSWYFWSDFVQALIWQAEYILYRKKEFTIVGDPAKPPIIIVPGVYETWPFMKKAINMLSVNGYRVHYVNALGYNTGRIPKGAKIIADYIAEQDLKDVIIVAHSKGGLVAKYLISYLEIGSRIKHVVTIATPFSGSSLSLLIPLRSIREFLPTSDIIKILIKEKGSTKRITSIYGQFDPIIPAGSYLKGAVNHKLPVNGHFRILANRKVLATMLESINSAL